MVEELGIILLTSSELFNLRTRLKDLKTKVEFVKCCSVRPEYNFLFVLGMLCFILLPVRDLVS